jgi:hypothetical protein
MTIAALAALTLLAACATAGDDWAKKGASEEQTTRDYLSCREQVRSLMRRDANIDHDIAAGRGRSDLRSASETRTLKESMDEYGDERREARRMENCMKARGYHRAGDTE